MKVGIIAYGLDRPMTGIGRYTVELVRALRDLKDGPEVVLLSAGALGPLADQDSSRTVTLAGCRLLPGLVTLGNVVIPLAARRHRLDLVHDPTGVTPFLASTVAAPTVVTVHDVFPWSCPGTSTRLDSLIYRHWLPTMLPHVNRVITVSAHSKQEIQRYLAVSPGQMTVIPYGISPRFHPLSHDDTRAHLKRRFGLGFPYALYVGAVTVRKNVDTALRAFAQICREYPDLQFVIAGPRAWKQTPIDRLIRELKIEHKIVLTGPLTDADLPALYNGAAIFVFPSLYEGFGLPPLEAMACGTPVVCSNTSSLPEVVEDAAVTVDPYNVEGLADAIRAVLGDGDLCQELRKRGLERAQQFTWERTAGQTLEVYQTLLR